MTTFRKFWQEKPRTGYAELFLDFTLFSDYDAADYTTTLTGTGTSVVSLAEACGALVITNSAADNDAVFSQGKTENWGFTKGKSTEFEARIKVSDATQCDLVLGLQITDTTPLAVSDGVFFRKIDDSTTIQLVVCKNAAETVVNLPTALGTNQYVTLGFYYDGTDTVQAMVDNVRVASAKIDNLPDDELLALSFGVQNGSAVARSLTIDYLRVVQQR